MTVFLLIKRSGPTGTISFEVHNNSKSFARELIANICADGSLLCLIHSAGESCVLRGHETAFTIRNIYRVLREASQSPLSPEKLEAAERVTGLCLSRLRMD